MRILSVPSGTQALIAAPSQPLQKEILDSIRDVIQGFPAIVEAHVLYCFAPKLMDEPSHVLVAILRRMAEFEEMANVVVARLDDILPPDTPFWILPLDCESALLAVVRSKECKL